MSTQDKITQLAIAALRSAPSVRIPQPTPFIRSSEKPRAVAIVSGAGDVRSEKSGGSFEAAWPFGLREVWI